MKELPLESELVVAIVKGTVVVGLVGVVIYSVATGQEIQPGVMALIVAVVGVYFGFEIVRWVASRK